MLYIRRVYIQYLRKFFSLLYIFIYLILGALLDLSHAISSWVPSNFLLMIDSMTSHRIQAPCVYHQAAHTMCFSTVYRLCDHGIVVCSSMVWARHDTCIYVQRSKASKKAVVVVRVRATERASEPASEWLYSVCWTLFFSSLLSTENEEEEEE